MKELVSVIVPIYNVEKYLDECVETIVGQTYKNIEIILVNDGSLDGSQHICEKWSKIDSRIKVITQENMGISSARNRGLSIALGEWVLFVDSDDFIAPFLLEAFIREVQKKNVKMVACGFTRDDEKIIHTTSCSKEIKGIKVRANEITGFRGGDYVTGILFNKNMLEKYQLKFNNNLKNLEDVCFLSIYRLFCEETVWIEHPGYYYRKNEQSVTSRCSDIEWQIDSWSKVLSAYDEYLEISNRKWSVKQKYAILKMRRKCINNIWSELYHGKIEYSSIKKLLDSFKVISFKYIDFFSNQVFLYVGEIIHKVIPRIEWMIYKLYFDLKTK